MFDFFGKTALITGATGGIGEAIAKALHGQGATVALAGTRAAVLGALRDHLRERVHIFTCNLGKPEEVEKLVPDAEAAMGSLDILVNNAGVARDGLAMRMRDADWAEVIEINLTAGFRLARAAMRGMVKRRFGRIINVASICGQIATKGIHGHHYETAKAALVGFTRAVAADWAPFGVTVNAIAPGGFMTDANRRRSQGTTSTSSWSCVARANTIPKGSLTNEPPQNSRPASGGPSCPTRLTATT